MRRIEPSISNDWQPFVLREQFDDEVNAVWEDLVRLSPPTNTRAALKLEKQATETVKRRWGDAKYSAMRADGSRARQTRRTANGGDSGATIKYSPPGPAHRPGRGMRRRRAASSAGND